MQVCRALYHTHSGALILSFTRSKESVDEGQPDQDQDGESGPRTAEGEPSRMACMFAFAFNHPHRITRDYG